MAGKQILHIIMTTIGIEMCMQIYQAWYYDRMNCSQLLKPVNSYVVLLCITITEQTKQVHAMLCKILYLINWGIVVTRYGA